MICADDMKWDDQGLLPAVVQDSESGVVLMLAWMNREAFELTCNSGFVHFYSRSRKSLWKKGETSGNTLGAVSVRIDCDRDAVLVLATPAGPTCHTGTTSCFFRDVRSEESDDGPGAVPSTITTVLEKVLLARKHSDGEKSYTRSLLDKGFPKIVEKIVEEQQELVAELPEGEEAAVIYETADLFFHVMVGLVAREIPIDRVWAELSRRFGVSGHVEKASR